MGSRGVIEILNSRVWVIFNGLRKRNSAEMEVGVLL